MFSRYFVQTGEQRGRRTHSSSPRVPQDNSEIVLLMQRSFSHYQVTEFLTHWTICPCKKAPGKKNRTLFCFYIVFHYYCLPNLRTKSCFFTILFQEVTLISLSNDAHLVSEKMPQWKLGGEKTEWLSPVRAANGSNFHWSQMFHPPQQGNTTKREQRVQENKAEKQETGAHKQMV